ncbi:MAG TPA: type I 3-dehydroquinate dehydratase [Planctomycetota bacterium]|nr:type I 3-dehydroquinate dehydratase [Planctomycetota bacterium]
MIVVVDGASEAAVRESVDGLIRSGLPRGTHFELRLDLFAALPEPELGARLELPCVVTCRRMQDGGRWQGSESDRRKLILRAVASGCAYVDIEEDVLATYPDVPKDRIIASLHDFHGTPADLPQRVDAMQRRARWVKVAARVNSPADLLLLQRIARTLHPGRVIAIGLGPGGDLSRLLPAAMGRAMTYVRCPNAEGEDRISVGGLPKIEDLTSLYYADAHLRAPTAVFGVLTDFRGSSLGPPVWNRFFRTHFLPCIYTPMRVSTLVGVREMFRSFGLRGVSVTTPYKESIVPFTDEADGLVTRIGACNTLVLRNGIVRGFNTDYHGVRRPLESALSRGASRVRTALVVGAGGAGRAAIAALTDLGLDVTVTAKSPERALGAASDLSVRYIEVPKQPPDVLVNATPLGGPRAPSGCPVDSNLLRPNQIIIEMNYGVETPLMMQAKAMGATVIPGSEMYVAQAAEQLRLFWTGVEDPISEMEKAYRWTIAEQRVWS